MSRHTKQRVSVDINHQTHVTGNVTIAAGNPRTGDGWQQIGEATNLGIGNDEETLANARLFA